MHERNKVANQLLELQETLACPVCHGRVRLVDRKFWCTEADCRRSYPIDEYDIPVMLPSEATIESEPAPSFSVEPTPGLPQE